MRSGPHSGATGLHANDVGVATIQARVSQRAIIHAQGDRFEASSLSSDASSIIVPMSSGRHVPIDEDDPCPFCLGINAAIDGRALGDNPFPTPPIKDSDEWYESDHLHWIFGFRSEEADTASIRNATSEDGDQAIKKGKVRFSRNGLHHHSDVGDDK